MKKKFVKDLIGLFGSATKDLLFCIDKELGINPIKGHE